MFHSRFLRPVGVLLLSTTMEERERQTSEIQERAQLSIMTCIEGNSDSDSSNSNNNNNNRVILCTTPTCLRGIDPSSLPVLRRLSSLFCCRRHLQARRMLPPSPPLFFLLRSLQHSQTPPPDIFLPVNSRLLLSSQPGQVGSAQPTTNDVITAVPTLPRVVVGPASTAALSSPPGWLSNVVLCPTAAAAAAHTPHQLPTVPISPSTTGRRAPGCCQSPAEGGGS